MLGLCSESEQTSAFSYMCGPQSGINAYSIASWNPDTNAMTFVSLDALSVLRSGIKVEAKECRTLCAAKKCGDCAADVVCGYCGTSRGELSSPCIPIWEGSSVVSCFCVSYMVRKYT